MHFCNFFEVCFKLAISQGLLAGLTEYQLEMVHYVVTGLSPRTPVSELCVDTKGQLRLGWFEWGGALRC